ncbi:MAG: beta-hydroxyacyl-ACP dehydratase [Deltaproteobacteria bacterium]|nr:beta-hydroxyacyl-ACP dehydratase [Deltaproteobacteria bacterium]
MEADRFMRERVLEMVPQRHPFRFIEDILELDEKHIVGVYRFASDEYFYRGHFPGFPVTPGVILIETMAQTAVVAFGLYLNLLRGQSGKQMDDLITLFTFAENVEFTEVVRPGDLVMVTGRKVYFRGNQIKVDCAMTRPDGSAVCSGLLAGKGIPRAQFAAKGAPETLYPITALRTEGMGS